MAFLLRKGRHSCHIDYYIMGTVERAPHGEELFDSIVDVAVAVDVAAADEDEVEIEVTKSCVRTNIWHRHRLLS